MSSTPSMAAALIRLERARGGYADGLRSYKVLLDGAAVGQVRRGQTTVGASEYIGLEVVDQA